MSMTMKEHMEMMEKIKKGQSKSKPKIVKAKKRVLKVKNV